MSSHKKPPKPNPSKEKENPEAAVADVQQTTSESQNHAGNNCTPCSIKGNGERPNKNVNKSRKDESALSMKNDKIPKVQNSTKGKDNVKKTTSNTQNSTASTVTDKPSQNNGAMMNMLEKIASGMTDVSKKVDTMWNDMYDENNLDYGDYDDVEFESDDGYDYDPTDFDIEQDKDHKSEQKNTHDSTAAKRRKLNGSDAGAGPSTAAVNAPESDGSDTANKGENTENGNPNASAKDMKDGAEDDDRLLRELADELDQTEENVSTDLTSESLTRVINKSFGQGLKGKKYDDLIEKIARPANALGLRSVKVNTLIWNLLQRPTRSMDEKFQTIQTSMAKAGINIARMVEMIASPHRLKHIDEEITLGTNALAVLGHGFHNLCLRRRELFKTEVDVRYANLCTADIPHTAWLFGDDLQETIKKIGADNQTADRISTSQRSGYRLSSRGNRGGHRGFYPGGGRRRFFHPHFRRGRGGHGYLNVKARGGARARGSFHRGPKNKNGKVSLTKARLGLEKNSSVPINNGINNEAMVHDSFQGSRLSQFVNNWEQITQDTEILQTVQGCTIEFDNEPTQCHAPRNLRHNKNEEELISNEIETLLTKQVIEETSHEEGEFLSNVFLRKKKNGKYRMILNLKQLNEEVEYHHFKMETFEQALKLITPGCVMASIDIKDAYYSVPIHSEYRKYLRFMWNGKVFQFSCLPNGLASGPRKYTKMMKPVYSTLRQQGHNITGYIDDLLLVSETVEQTKQSAQVTIELLQNLGFILNWEKSILEPKTKITHLGFIIDSEQMTVTLTQEKTDRLTNICKDLYMKSQDTIRNVAKVIGGMVSSFPGVEQGPLHYREMEKAKTEALKLSKGDFDSHMTITPSMKNDLTWWINNLSEQSRLIVRDNPQITVETDASLLGWGASCNGDETGGRWSSEEAQSHINYLELMGAFLALQAFRDKFDVSPSCRPLHVQLLMDNTTAVAYIKNMGGREMKLNQLSNTIWTWALQKRIWLSASHIPGKLNVTADYNSRNFNDRTEWSLHQSVFDRLVEIWGPVELDLFATRLNAKCSKFVSWNKDPYAFYVDAFSRSWQDTNNYIFPPFSVIAKCLQKLRQDGAQAIIIIPLWTTQPWFTNFLSLLTDNPILLPKTDRLLTLEHNQRKHPLRKKLQMLAGKVSGNYSENRMFQAKLPTSCCTDGSQGHINNMEPISGNGIHFVFNSRLIRCNPVLLQS